MGETRKVHKVLKSKPTVEGAGVHLKRVFGYSQVPTVVLDSTRPTRVPVLAGIILGVTR